MSYTDEYRIRKQIRDLSFFAWVQACATIVIAIIALPPACESYEIKKNEFRSSRDQGRGFRDEPRGRRYPNASNGRNDMRRIDEDR